MPSPRPSRPRGAWLSRRRRRLPAGDRRALSEQALHLARRWRRVRHLRPRAREPARRLGLLGLYQGGVYSLPIAAQTGGAAAVVAYCPITDFEQWLEEPGRLRGNAGCFHLIRRHLPRQSGARNEQEFSELLARVSPLHQTERIRCPVLLTHGDRGRSAGVEQSRLLAARLESRVAKWSCSSCPAPDASSTSATASRASSRGVQHASGCNGSCSVGTPPAPPRVAARRQPRRSLPCLEGSANPSRLVRWRAGRHVIQPRDK